MLVPPAADPRPSVLIVDRSEDSRQVLRAVLERRARGGRRFYGCANYRPDDESSCQWTSWQKPVPAGEPAP